VRIAPIKKENKGADQDFWWIADGEDGSKGYQLKERDLIKVGDIMLRVHKVINEFDNFKFNDCMID